MRRPGQRVGAGAIAIGELHRFAIARRESETLGLLECVSPSIDVFQSVDKTAGQAEKRIRPVGTQLRRLSKRGHRLGELLLRGDGFLPSLLGLAVDAMQMAL